MGANSTDGRWLPALCLVVLVAVATAGATVTAQTAGWTEYAAGPGNTGYNPDAVGPATNVTEAWHFQSGSDEASATVTGGVVYGYGTAEVFAVDAATGEVRWRRSVTGRPDVVPAVGDRLVYHVSNRGDALTVLGVDRERGDVVWAEPIAAAGFTTPSVARGTLYVTVQQDGRVILRAYDLDDRTLEWVYETPTGPEDEPPAVGPERIYVLTRDAEDESYAEETGTLYALSTADGSVAWEQSIPEVKGDPTYANGTVLTTREVEDRTGNFTEVVALEAATGAERWSHRREANWIDDVATDGERVYVGTWVSNREANLTALDLADGSEVWSVRTDNVARGTPAVGPESVFVTTYNRSFAAYDAETGVLRWNRSTPAGFPYGPKLGNETLVVSTGDGHVYGFVGDGPADALFAGPVRGTGEERPPTDPDGDGVYEDVDGDGDVDFDDAIALAFADTVSLSAAQRSALDVDGDGDVDFDDAVDLAFSV